MKCSVRYGILYWWGHGIGKLLPRVTLHRSPWLLVWCWVWFGVQSLMSLFKFCEFERPPKTIFWQKFAAPGSLCGHRSISMLQDGLWNFLWIMRFVWDFMGFTTLGFLWDFDWSLWKHHISISWNSLWDFWWVYEILMGFHDLTIFQFCRTAYGISPDRNLRDRQVILLLLLLQSFTLSWQKDKRCKTGQIIEFCVCFPIYFWWNVWIFLVHTELGRESFLLIRQKARRWKSQSIWDRFIQMEMVDCNIGVWNTHNF